MLEGEKYTYVVTKYGYKSVSGSFVAGANTNIDATLKEADVNNAINKLLLYGVISEAMMKIMV